MVLPLTRRRALLELVLGYALILAVLWTQRPLQRPLYLITAVVLLAIIICSFAGTKSTGFRTTNVLRSLWIVVAAILIAIIAVLIAQQLGTLNLPPTPSQFFKSYIGYILWTLVQQLLLTDFFLRRLQFLLPTSRAVIVTALLFAIAHLPNPILAPITLLFGLVACTLFLRYRNLYPLALAHAVLGITISVTLPGPVTHNMRVGLGYLRYFHDHPRPPLQLPARKN